MSRNRLSRATFLAYPAALLASVLCSAARGDDKPARPKRPPNVLWLVGENLCLDLGCYGEKLVHTPNLDKLAAEGMRYTHVYATAPVCSASRSAFMTGMYQTSIGAHNARSHRDDGYKLPKSVRPLTHWLRDAGYFSANVKAIDGQEVGTGKVDLNFTWDGKLFDSEAWTDLKAHQPFYAQVNSPEVEYDIYDRKSASKERVEWVGEKDHPKLATRENVTPPPYYPDHEITRQEWARFLNSVSGMDRRIGIVLDRLKADGLLEDTVVIFFADNGRLEARGIHWCYDSGLHVPLIVRWPKNYPAPPQYRPGTVSDQVLSLLDLNATTLGIAGMAKPKGMESQVFLGEGADAPRKYAFAARDRIDETVQRIRSVHDGRYHYVRNFMPERPFAALNRYKEKCFLVMPLMRQLHAEGKLNEVQAALLAPRLPEEELYDIAKDPHEVKNLAASSDATHRAARKRLREELEKWIKDTKDQGAEREPPEVVAPFEKEMHEWFGTPDWAKRIPHLVGHRGLIRHAPENTLAGFAACIELRLGFELDVRRTRDGHLICLHDDDVQRTTDGKGKVAELTLAELRKLDAGAWFDPAFAGQRVPTLEEVFALLKERQAGSVLVALDLKIDDETVEADVVRLAKKYGVLGQVVCIGRAIIESAVRKKLRAADPKTPVAVLAPKAEDLPAALEDPQGDWVYVRFVPTAEQVTKVHRAGRRVFLVGPSIMGREPENWRQARGARVDAVLTDFPLDCRLEMKRREQ